MNRRGFLQSLAGLAALGLVASDEQPRIDVPTRGLHYTVKPGNRALTLPDPGGFYVTSVEIADQFYTPIDWGFMR